jgi:predicted NBD/HSP70 family sugar kinase
MHHLGLDIGGTKMEAVLLAARGLSLASTAPYTEGEL